MDEGNNGGGRTVITNKTLWFYLKFVGSWASSIFSASDIRYQNSAIKYQYYLELPLKIETGNSV